MPASIVRKLIATKPSKKVVSGACREERCMGETHLLAVVLDDSGPAALVALDKGHTLARRGRHLALAGRNKVVSEDVSGCGAAGSGRSGVGRGEAHP